MAQTVPPPTTGAPAQGTSAVLVIDGNEEHQILSVTALGRRGFRVSVADTAREGLRLVATHRFDAIVLAHKLRDASGLDVLRALHERLPAVPKIFVVQEGGEEIALRALSSGASGYLVKTPRYHELLPAEVEEQLSKTRDRTRLEDQQKVLQETQARFQEFVESTREPIFVLDSAGAVVAFNEAMCRVMGYSREELSRMGIRDLLAPRADPEAVPRLLDITRGADLAVPELAFHKKDGSEIYMALTPHPVRRGGEIVGIEVLARDITERKRAETELRDLYSWLSAVYESTRDAILVTDRDLHVLQWNPAALELFQVDEAAMAHQDAGALIRSLASRSRDASQLIGNYEVYADDPTTVFEGEIEVVSPEPRVYWRYTTPVRNVEGRHIGRVWTFRDITERKRAETEIIRREAQLAEAQHVARLGSWEYDIAADRETWSDELYRLFGWEPQSFPPAIEAVLARTHPDDRAAVMQAIESLRTQHMPGSYDHRIVRTDGVARILRSEGRLISDSTGRPVRALGTSLDVTEIRRAEQVRAATYRISEAANTTKDLQDLFRSIHLIVGELIPARNFYIALYDPASDSVSFPYFADEKEPPPPPQKLGRGLTEYVLRTGKPLLASPEAFADLVRQGEVESVGPASVDWVGVPLIAQDRTVGALVIQSYEEGVRYGDEARDILEFVSTQIAMAIDRKRAEQALRASEERFRRIAENAQDLIYRYRFVDPRGFEYVSPASTRLTGYTPEEHYADPELGFKIIVPEDRPILEDYIRSAATGALRKPGEPILFRWVRKDGNIVWTEQRNVPIYEGEGRLVAVEGIARDVTQRILAEQELRENEERFRLLARATQDAIFDWDPDTDTMVWSEAIHAMLGLTPDEIQPTGAWWDGRIHPEDRDRAVANTWDTIHQERDSWAIEYRVQRRDGSYASVLDRGFLVRDDERRPHRVIGSVTDITDRKKAEEALRARAGQQAAVAVLGQHALEDRPLSELMGEVVALVATTLDVEFAKVLELTPAGESLVLKSGVGWHEGLVGKAVVSAGKDSQAGHTLLSNGPVVVEDMRTESRFRGPPLLLEHGIVSGMSVIIQGEDRAFGVLGAHTARRRTFTQDDVNFLQSIANVLANAIERQRSDASLRASEERYRLLFERNPHPMWVFDLETLRFLAVNDAAVRHYGYSREEFLGMTIKDIRPPTDIPVLLASVSQVQEGLDTAGVWRHRKKDGAIIHAEITSHSLRFGGRPGKLVLANDVTERLQAQERLRKEKETAQLYLDVAGVILLILDREGRVRMINRKGSEVLGYAPQEMIGRDWFSEFLPERIREEVRLVFRSIMAGDRDFPAFHENPILTKAGKEPLVAWHNTLLRDEGGEIVGTISSGEDITERKRAENELAKSERKFRALFEAAAEGILLIDHRAKILDVNPAAEGVIGGSRQDLVGKNLQEFLPSEDLTRARGYLRDVLRGSPVSEPFEIDIRTLDGRRRSLEVRSRVIQEASGRPTVETVIRDVTEQREMQRRLLQSERLASMGQLSAYVAHEINTPLTSISLLTASIARRIKDEDVLAKLEKINVQRRHAAAIIVDLLSFSRHRELKATETDLRSVIEGALEQVEPYRKATVALVHDVRDRPVVANVDPLRVQEVVVNLVKNALEATESGSVTIRVEDRADQAALIVADTGTGMTREVRGRLFEPFFTTKQPGEGTGLGLAMCHSIVTSHGGTIEVGSEPGKGTTFTVLLPKGAAH